MASYLSFSFSFLEFKQSLQRGRRILRKESERLFLSKTQSHLGQFKNSLELFSLNHSSLFSALYSLSHFLQTTEPNLKRLLLNSEIFNSKLHLQQIAEPDVLKRRSYFSSVFLFISDPIILLFFSRHFLQKLGTHSFVNRLL